MSIRRTDLSCFSLACRYATSLVVVCEFGGNVLSLLTFLTVGEVGGSLGGCGDRGRGSREGVAVL